ncbi:MAG: hypothetical protein ACTTKL_01335, partial [Treponema sp.]
SKHKLNDFDGGNNMKKLSLCVAASVFLFSSCVSFVEEGKMQLAVKSHTPLILNLKYYGNNDIDQFKQSEGLIKGTLINPSGEEFGYYKLKFYDDYYEDITFTLLASGLFPLIPLGFPTHSADMHLHEKLYIFDSEGDLVKEYYESDKFTQVAGLYYGHSPTRRAAKKFSKMSEKIFEMAAVQSNEINQALKKKGPVNEKNKDAALKKIEEFLDKKNDVGTYTYDVISTSEPLSTKSSNSYSSAGQNSNNAANEYKLKDGKYACSGTNVKMSLNYGLMTFYEGYSVVATGNYRISGNQLVVTLSTASGKWEDYRGMTFSYTITDSQNFYLGDERWSYVGYF